MNTFLKQGVNEIQRKGGGLQLGEDVAQAGSGHGDAMYLTQAGQIGERFDSGWQVFRQGTESSFKSVRDVLLAGFCHRELFQRCHEFFDRHILHFIALSAKLQFQGRLVEFVGDEIKLGHDGKEYARWGEFETAKNAEEVGRS